MAIITEDYVSFETAKLLKEKGFDGECDLFGRTDESETTLREASKIAYNQGIDDECVIIPTLQMAMKWLREVYNIHISVYPFNRELPITENTYYTCDVATTKDSPMRGHLRGIWKTYEETVEVAIKYCLENLI